jgi:hypothetical protein
MKTFRIIRTSKGYMVVSLSNGMAICHEYPTYPANVINVLINIGYKESI